MGQVHEYPFSEGTPDATILETPLSKQTRTADIRADEPDGAMDTVTDTPPDETPPKITYSGALLNSEAMEATEQIPLVAIDAFEEIFTRFQSPLTNFVFRLVGNREQAYDLTQDVFVKIYRALAGGTTVQAPALSSWLYRIASNTSTDALRRRRLIKELPLSLFNEDRAIGASMPRTANADSSPQSGSDEASPGTVNFFGGGYDGGRFENHVVDHTHVQAVLRRMTEEDAAVLVKYGHDGFSCGEIAQAMHTSPSAIKMQLMRARERFIALYEMQDVADDAPASTRHYSAKSARPRVTLQEFHHNLGQLPLKRMAKRPESRRPRKQTEQAG